MYIGRLRNIRWVLMLLSQARSLRNITTYIHRSTQEDEEYKVGPYVTRPLRGGLRNIILWAPAASIFPSVAPFSFVFFPTARNTVHPILIFIARSAPTAAALLKSLALVATASSAPGQRRPAVPWPTPCTGRPISAQATHRPPLCLLQSLAPAVRSLPPCYKVYCQQEFKAIRFWFVCRPFA
jgi:hypothetical protein